MRTYTSVFLDNEQLTGAWHGPADNGWLVVTTGETTDTRWVLHGTAGQVRAELLRLAAALPSDTECAGQGEFEVIS